MHLEVRGKGRNRKYYLAHSLRHGDKVGKLRVYVGGAGISSRELSERRARAEALLRRRVEASKRLSDPFETVLSANEIEELKFLEAKADLSVIHLSQDDWRRFTEAFTYDTNAIEGSTINSKEVVQILEEGRWPEKPKGDISETYGVAKAIEHIRNTREHVSVGLILELHQIVFQNSKPFAGKLRSKGVEVVIADALGNIVHRGAPASQVRKLLYELSKWYEKNKTRYPPLVLAAVVHNQFENIHPFQDGNGRVGRLLLNNVLLKHGLPPINIELRNRTQYYAALQSYEKEHNLRPTVELLLSEYRNLKRFLKR